MQAPAAARPLLFAALLVAAVSALSWLQPSAPSGPPPAAAAPLPRPAAPNPAALGWNASDCEFEVIALDARFFPTEPHPSGRLAAGRTLLLDQCAGNTWVLVPHGGPPDAVWRRLERE